MAKNSRQASFGQSQPKVEFTFGNIAEKELLNLRYIPPEIKIALNGLSVIAAEVQKDSWGYNHFVGISPENLVDSLEKQNEEAAARWFKEYVTDKKKEYVYHTALDRIYFPAIAGSLLSIDGTRDSIK